VIGVSPDTAAKHCRFKEKYGLPYTLVADTDHAVASAYGVWQKKSLFGHKYMGVVRTTFLIAPDGGIAHIFENVKPIGHAAEVLAELKRLRR
jgi:thioredoxin-dependent peroxiredoxin